MIQSETIQGVRLRYAVLNPQVDDIQVAFNIGSSVKQLSTNYDVGMNFNYANTELGIPIGRVIVDGQEVIPDILKTIPRDELYMLPNRTVHIGKAPKEAIWAVQGSPPLLRNGVNVIDEGIKRDQTGADIWTRDGRRTATGIRSDGFLVLVSTIDEISLDKLVDVLRALGCVHALNGDGGGSSYLYPADTGWGRKLGSAIVAKEGIEVSEVYSVWKNVRITSPYGWRSRNGGEMHHGIDMATYRGDSVPAFWGGKVVYAGATQKGTGLGDYGISVIIEDEHEVYHLYAHLDAVKTSVGSVVKRGDTLGFMGNTGASDAPHLHYEVRTKGSSWGWKQTSDPTLYLKLISMPKGHQKGIDGLGTYQVNDSKPLDTVIIDGRMYAPVRDVAESLGATVAHYDNMIKHAIIKSN